VKSAKQLISTIAIKEGIRYLEKNPLENLPKLVDWADRLTTRENEKRKVKIFKDIVNDPSNNWNNLIKRVFNELHPNVQKKALINFFVNAGVKGLPLLDESREKYGCTIPWTILMDPTTACNLKCTGCWAAEYDKSDSLSYEELDRIITEGKELGMYFYIFSGGEPLTRKNDLLKLAEKHNDCAFLAFTNATLIDEEFAKELQRLGNFFFAISVEGFEEETDLRRGKGTFKKVMKAMDILKQYGIGFGFSTCYHSKNTEVIGSDKYVDLMIEKGCMFGWYFTYMPLGKDAPIDLVATPEQREYMYHKVREFRQTKAAFIIDFWNDGEYVNGCIAGGKNYLHINANGDVEPCAFIHYSNVNIKDVSLIEALKSPLLAEYKRQQPFNENHLKPCPLMDNPEKLREMVQKTKAHSTQPLDQEAVEDLTAKFKDISERWTPTAERLWTESHGEKCDHCACCKE